MGFYGVEAVSNLNFKCVDPRKLTKAQSKAVGRLIFLSARVDYPKHAPKALDNVVAHREQNRRNLHRFVPGGAAGTLQRYTQLKSVVAYDDQGELVAYLSTANNSSSRSASPAPRLEIMAKEHVPQLIKSRFHAVGIVAVAPQRHPIPDEPFITGIVNLVDVMNYASMVDKPVEQPWAGYTWDGEKWLEQTYTGSGAVHKLGESCRIYDFGDGVSVRQDRWSQDAGIWVVKEQITSKDESWAAINHVLESAGYN